MATADVLKDAITEIEARAESEGKLRAMALEKNDTISALVHREAQQAFKDDLQLLKALLTEELTA
jgi:hypothetical protein